MSDSQAIQQGKSLRHEWYQNETTVVLSILQKGVQSQEISIDFQTNNVDVKLQGIPYRFPLFASIYPQGCTYTVRPFKVELRLQKQIGVRWTQLTAEEIAICGGTTSTPSETSSATSTAATTSPYTSTRNWREIECAIDAQEANEKPEGDAALQKLFQDIYGKGSDEVKKAMNKSFMESGGTVLSTNWGEISKDKVTMKLPDGMEWKKW